MKLNRKMFLASVSCFGVDGPLAFAADTAEIIYSGGAICTMDDANPRVEAVAVKGGRILAAGTSADVMKLKGRQDQMVDLGGRTMLPGFVDPHGHMMMGGMQALSANVLPRPMVRSRHCRHPEDAEGLGRGEQGRRDGRKLIIGFGYDDSQLEELRAPTKEELDEVSKDIPVLIVHQSGHMGACNSKSLEVIGYTAETPDPQAASSAARTGSQEPSGISEEVGLLRLHSENFAQCRPRGHDGACHGGRGAVGLLRLHDRAGRPLVPAVVEILKTVADEGGFKIDVVAYADVLVDREFIKSRCQHDLYEPLPRGRRQAHHRRLAARLHGMAGQALLRSRRQLPAGLFRLCRGQRRTGDRGHRMGLCQQHPDAGAFQRRSGRTC